MVRRPFPPLPARSAVEKWTEDGSGDGMAPKKPTDAGM